MIYRTKDLDLQITDFNYYHDLTLSGEFIPSQTSNLKQVEVIKFLDKHTYDMSFQSSGLGDHRF